MLQLLKLSRRHLRLRNPTLNRLRNLSYSVLVQDYTADINIFLGKRWHNPLKVLSPRQMTEIRQLIREGELATWERMAMIRNCTAISRKLDSILEKHGWQD